MTRALPKSSIIMILLSPFIIIKDQDRQRQKPHINIDKLKHARNIHVDIILHGRSNVSRFNFRSIYILIDNYRGFKHLSTTLGPYMSLIKISYNCSDDR